MSAWMKDVMKAFLLIINLISFIGGIICTIFIFFCEFFGYDKGNAFLKRINFPLDDDIILIGLIFAAVLFVSALYKCGFFSKKSRCARKGVKTNEKNKKC